MSEWNLWILIQECWRIMNRCFWEKLECGFLLNLANYELHSFYQIFYQISTIFLPNFFRFSTKLFSSPNFRTQERTWENFEIMSRGLIFQGFLNDFANLFDQIWTFMKFYFIAWGSRGREFKSRHSDHLKAVDINRYRRL